MLVQVHLEPKFVQEQRTNIRMDDKYISKRQKKIHFLTFLAVIVSNIQL